MKPKKKEERKRGPLCADAHVTDVTVQATDDGGGKFCSEDDDHLLSDSDLENRIFVGNISYRVSCISKDFSCVWSLPFIFRN